jgi:hypothetical protein
MKKTQTTSGGEIITTVYGTEWPVRLGRVDSSTAGAAGRIPADGAPVAEITAFMKNLGVKEGEWGLMLPFGWKRLSLVSQVQLCVLWLCRELERQHG